MNTDTALHLFSGFAIAAFLTFTLTSGFNVEWKRATFFSWLTSIGIGALCELWDAIIGRPNQVEFRDYFHTITGGALWVVLITFTIFLCALYEALIVEGNRKTGNYRR